MSEKTKLKLLSALFAAMVLFTNKTFAAIGSFEQLYIVGGNGDYTNKTNFGWDENPWLYARLPQDGLNIVSSWWWQNGGGISSASGNLSNEREVWLQIPDWTNIRKTGAWTVEATYFFPGNNSNPVGYGRTGFNVAPEPISSVLFLVGGAALAAKQYRRKRKK